MVEFKTLIKPIPINQKLKRGKGNRMFLGKEYRESWTDIQCDFKSQYQGELIQGFVKVEIVHSYKRYDIDSLCKSVLDILQGITYQNDSKVIECNLKKDIDSNELYLKVFVEEIKLFGV
jgi:Holliday junction resolvase RusA-like endonuclease